MIFLILLPVIIWIFTPWTNRYFYGSAFIGGKKYGDRNPFKVPLRKIYRPRSISNMDYDIYVIKKVDRFRKVMEYILVNNDDEPEVTKQLKEQSNG